MSANVSGKDIRLELDDTAATATAQLATTAVTYVAAGDTTAFAPPGATAAVTWVVTQASNPEGNREVKKQSLTLREEI